MVCELNPDHDPDNYCEKCHTCFDCLDEEAQAMIEKCEKKYVTVLKEIVSAHLQSTVAWKAMAEAEKLIEGK